LKILFDQGVPKPLQTHLAGHTVRRTFELGWATKRNGELLGLAEEAGFDMLVTTDQNLQHQQDLKAFKLAVFILGRGNWPEIRPYAARIVARIGTITTPGVYFFQIPP
jgi:hypothetical protein